MTEPKKANVFEPQFDEATAGAGGRARLGRQAGSERLGMSLYELPPGFRRAARHYHLANEELLVVLLGRPLLIASTEERELTEGEVVAFPRGERGAHKLVNPSDEIVRFLIFSEMNAPDVVVYPDSKKVLAISKPPGSPGDEEELAYWFPISAAVDHWQGEPGADESGPD
jgi:uncharacterized cupin superfamily protein